MPKPKRRLSSDLVRMLSAPQLAMLVGLLLLLMLLLLLLTLLTLLTRLAKRLMPRVEVRWAVRALQVYHDRVF